MQFRYKVISSQQNQQKFIDDLILLKLILSNI